MGFGLKRIFNFSTRLCVPIFALVGCMWVLSDRFEGISTASVLAQVVTIPIWAWTMALLATMGSFWAVGRYDAIAHRHFRTGINTRTAHRCGAASIALAQLLGLGFATGALARWRMMERLSMVQAAQISAFVSITFMVAMALVLSFAVLVLPTPGWMLWPALSYIAATGGLMCLHISRADTTSDPIPSLSACVALIGWTALDTMLAALALYVLIPDPLGLSFTTFYPIFLMALGCALLSGTPGGVGPFELALFSMLPMVPTQELVTAIAGYRLVYYALPALVACVALIKPDPKTSPPDQAASTPLNARAETGLLAQNGGQWRALPTGVWATWPTRQTLTGLFDPSTTLDAKQLKHCAAQAKAENRIPYFYKLTKCNALAVRRCGWAVMHHADEAIIDVQSFELDVPKRRNLRRKLRAAEREGVRVLTTDALPLDDMARIDTAWQKLRGGARGGTAGRFCPTYLAGQHVVLAYKDGNLCGFASFHRCAHEWALDLMRTCPETPDGSMHLLVSHAIQTARANGAAQMSLAAVTACPNPHRALDRMLARQAVARAGGPGLRQFKSAFGPRWQPLYMAAPNRISLWIAALDIARAVLRPMPLARTNSDQAHNKDENNEFASRLAS